MAQANANLYGAKAGLLRRSFGRSCGHPVFGFCLAFACWGLAQAAPRQEPVRDAKTYQKQACRPSKYSSRPVCPVVVGPKETTPSIPEPSLALAPLAKELLEIATLVERGRIECELGVVVTVSEIPNALGYFRVVMRQFNFTMSPVVSATGAIRLEDKVAGALWLQLPHKSMLMSQKLGSRLADECVAPQQAQSAKTDPKSADLLDRPAANTAGSDNSGIVIRATQSVATGSQ